MSLKLRLISENPDLLERFEIIEEQDNLKKGNSLYVKGPFIGCNQINKNKRLYNLDDTRAEVNRYIEEMVIPGRAMGELNHPSCHLLEAELLTDKGFVTFEKLPEDASVYTLNTDTNEIELHKINKKIVSEYSGEMYHITGRNIDTVVTPTHRFPIERRYGKREFVTIEEIYNDRKKYNKSKFLKIGDWVQKSSEFYVLKGDNYIHSNKCKGNITEDLPIKFDVFIKFLGIYLAEGNCSNPTTIHRNGYSIHISQKKESVRAKIRELLSQFPEEIEWVETDVDFRTCDKRLHNLLYPLGNCYQKYIPDEFKNLSSELLEELIYWFNLGDGRFSTTCHENGYVQRNIFTVSKRLIDDLQECLLKSGGCGNITTIITEADYKFADHVIKAENKVPLYQLTLATTKNIYLDPRFLKIEKVNLGQDKVACVNVTNSNFYCRENGKAFWSGNSPEVNLERACHLVTELREDGDTFYGKSKVLSTPLGQLLRSLINDGVKVGMSTRALGSLHEESTHNVVRNMRLVAVDAVADPSFPKAFVNGILESKQWVVAADGHYEEIYENFEKTISNLPRKNMDGYLKEQILKFINALS
jgi:hypothetical protein